MQFQFAAADVTFRSEVRSFFDDHAPPDRGAGQAQKRAYRRLLGECGFLTGHWPVEYGGLGASHMQQVVFKEESFRANAETGGAGVNLIGPTLILHGSEAQKAVHLPRIASDEVHWCQGFSEPGAGSDLASLQTRAVRDGDDYLINGQKIWTSEAHNSDWIFVLTRTDPEAPKHRGISFFLVDLKTPGVTVSPLLQLTGMHGFNQVFFDNVRVPSANLVGQENRGWYIATTTLDFERSGIERVLTADRDLRRMEEWWRTRAGRCRSAASLAVARNGLADLRISVEAGRLLAYRVAWMQGRGLVPNYEASMAKMYNSDVGQAVARTAINLAGLSGQLRPESPYALLGGAPAFRYMDSVRLTIGQGTGEIQRNVIATRGLGLPR